MHLLKTHFEVIYLISVSIRVALVLFYHHTKFLGGCWLHKWLKSWPYHCLHTMMKSSHLIHTSSNFSSFFYIRISQSTFLKMVPSELIYRVHKQLSWNRGRESAMFGMTSWLEWEYNYLWAAALLPVSLSSLWNYKVSLQAEDVFKYFKKPL